MNATPTEGMGQKRDESGGTPASPEKEILQELFFDEQEYLGHLRETVQRALKFFKIEPQAGRVVLTDDAKRRKVPDQVRLLLAGRYFAWKYGVIPSDKMNYRDISADLNRPPSGVSAELTHLVRDGEVARDEGGLYSIPFHRIDVTLREFEASPSNGGNEANSSVPKGTTPRRVQRQRSDPIVQAMLEKGADLSEYGWVTELDNAMEKGLAALVIAENVYGQKDMTATQMATFLTRMFPLAVTRGAINMGFLKVKGQYVSPLPRGAEIAYRILPLGKKHLEETVARLQDRGRSEGVGLNSAPPNGARAN